MSHQPADPALDRTIALLDRLVGFDTESDKSNLALIDFVEDYLLGLGARFVRIPSAAGDKAALFVTFGPDEDGGVLLSGHTDVVPVAGQQWTSPPFILRRDGDRLYGRGTCDMKGFDALCLALAPEFLAAPLQKPVHILLSYDEETTCGGCLDSLARRIGIEIHAGATEHQKSRSAQRRKLPPRHVVSPDVPVLTRRVNAVSCRSNAGAQTRCREDT